MDEFSTIFNEEEVDKDDDIAIDIEENLDAQLAEVERIIADNQPAAHSQGNLQSHFLKFA